MVRRDGDEDMHEIKGSSHWIWSGCEVDDASLVWGWRRFESGTDLTVPPKKPGWCCVQGCVGEDLVAKQTEYGKVAKVVMSQSTSRLSTRYDTIRHGDEYRWG